MFSQFYILSNRGDTIISRAFRDNEIKSTEEIFFTKVKHDTGSKSPIFMVDGIIFLFLKRNGLYFVCTTQQNVNPGYCLEFLQNLTNILKDFCGVLSEDALRRNFILAYEIIDEMMDCGYPQHTSTEKLKYSIRTEAVIVDEPIPSVGGVLQNKISQLAVSALSGRLVPPTNQKTVPSCASHRPVGLAKRESAPSKLEGASSVVASVMELTKNTLSGGPRVCQGGLTNTNEIFVDVLERLTVVMNSAGTILSSSIDGRIQMKSYLLGHPLLRVALNADIKSTPHTSSALRGLNAVEPNSFACTPKPDGDSRAPSLDDCNFHECVDYNDFGVSQVLHIRPPDGEFVVMNYRITDPFRVPFSIKPTLEQVSPTQLDVFVDIQANIPNTHFGGNLVLVCPVPPSTVSVNVKAFPGNILQVVEYSSPDKKVFWTIKKLQGGSSVTLRCRITLADSLPWDLSHDDTVILIRKGINPITLTFEIPMYNISSVQVKYLRISHVPSGSGTGPASQLGNPFRWVRYVTQANSYVCRL